MPLDTRIISSLHPVKIDYEDAETRQGKKLQLRHLLQQGEIADQTIAANKSEMAARKRAEEDDAKLKTVLETSDLTTPEGTNATIGSLYKTGNWKTAQAIEKQRTEQMKAETENRMKQTELHMKQSERLGMIANGIVDEASYRAGIGLAAAEGILPQKTAAELMAMPWNEQTAAQVKQFGAQALSAKDHHAAVLADGVAKRAAEEEKRKVTEFDATLPGKVADAKVKGIEAQQMATIGMSQAERERLDAAEVARKQQADLTRRGQDITVRGQNMTDTRSREMAEITRDQKPPTAAENRTYGFYSRAKDAGDVLGKMQGDMVKKGMFSQGWQKWAPNFAQSEENQVYSQAQRQFTEARLRKDSGASIPPHEFENDRMTYFPQPGDGPKVLKRKEDARNNLLKSLHRESGRAAALYDGEGPGEPANPAAVNLKDLSDDDLMKLFNKK